MRQMQPLIWTKGVLLSPQHLQTQDAYLEDQLHFRLATVSQFAWGFSALQIDRETLAAGLLSVTRAAAIFPDGLLYDAPGPDALPPPRPLDACWRPDQTALGVFLAVPEHRPGTRQVSGFDDGHGTRYVAEVAMRRDETTGLTERPVQLARKNVRLLVEGEPLAGTTALRVGRVLRNPAGDYALDPAVVPPIVDLAASDVLRGLARRLAELLNAKSAALSGNRRQRNRGLAEFGATDVAQFWLLYTVNSFLPQLRHVADTRLGHPELLYATLLALAGSLTTFATGPQPPLPAYDHEDLGGCFARVDARIRELLDTALPMEAVSLRLKAVRPSVHATALDDDRYLAPSRLYLAVAADTDRAELLRLVPQLIKISSADRLDGLIRQGLPGVSLTHAPNVSGAVPVKLDFEYFAVAASGPDWEAIRRARNFAAYVPSNVGNPRLELVVVLADRG